MPNTRLLGPYELTRSNITSYVTRKMPGIFVLGSSKGKGFRVRYVGRSDRDIIGNAIQDKIIGPRGNAHREHRRAVVCDDKAGIVRAVNSERRDAI